MGNFDREYGSWSWNPTEIHAKACKDFLASLRKKHNRHKF